VSDAPTEAELRRLIRHSQVFDEVLKRSWLNALPLMAPVHRRELRDILEMEAATKPSPNGRGWPKAG
jgi:hypothetical protein